MKHKCHHTNLQTCLIWQVWNRSKCSQLFPFSLLSGVLAFSVLPCLEQCLSWSGWCPINWSVSEGWERWSGHGKSLDWVNKLNSLWGKENQKSGSFRNTEASALSCEQLASLFPPCVQAKEMRNHRSMGLRQTVRHRFKICPGSSWFVKCVLCWGLLRAQTWVSIA